MVVVDFILNCACLLLWLNWRSKGLASLASSPGIALIGTLKRAERRHAERWPSSLGLAVVLFARAILYTEVGGSLRWMPSLSLGPFVMHFRTDEFGRMLLFSLLGFAMFLAVFYFSLLLMAAVNRSAPRDEPWMALVRAHLGHLACLPAWLMLLAPFIITFLLWLGLGHLFAVLKLVVPAKSLRHLVEQAFVIGLGAWLLWQYVLATVLLFHLVSSYVFFGSAPFWSFITTTARNLLQPLARLPLRAGKIDFTPVLALLLLAAIVIFAPRGLAWLYGRFAV